ncbi:hypothetical protein AAFX24_27525 [Vibrio mediterranei]|uniref:hypothetical protein n=1 Tax=Vibrio mediterranei TaxID=689 RepID=UPI0038CEA903
MKCVSVVISHQDSDAVSDFAVADWYKRMLCSNEVVRVASIVMFNELRVGVMLREISPFSFEFEEQVFNVNRRGHVEPFWPAGFLNQQSFQTYALMAGCDRRTAVEAVGKGYEKERSRRAYAKGKQPNRTETRKRV